MRRLVVPKGDQNPERKRERYDVGKLNRNAKKGLRC